MNRNEYLSRRQTIMTQLPEGSVLLMFSGDELRKTADEMYPFFTNRNFLYLTGITQCRTALLIARNGSITERLYALPKDVDKEVWTGRRYTEDELSQISGVASVCNIDSLENDLHQIFSGCKYRTLFLCLDMLEPFRQTGIEYYWMKRVGKAYPQIKLENIFPIVAGMRRYKSSEEVLAIRNAMKITGAGIARAMRFCEPGVMEYQIEAEFLHEIAMTGQRSPAFPPIVATGTQIFYLHNSSPMQRVMDGDLVLTDVGAAFDEYNTDVSRVFPANGKFTEKQAQIYLIALEANRAIMQDVRPGRDFAITNDICKKEVFQGLKCLGLIADFADISKYVWHKTTHHVGLNTHDVGGYEDPMAEGMVFTVDVGIYVREWGIGLRIEDDVLVTTNGCENLSAEIPVEIDEIEALMAR